MTDKHEHQLIFVEEGEGVDFKVRWCLDCGMLFRQINGKTYAEMIPEWSRERLEEMDRRREAFKFVTQGPLRKTTSKKPKSRLGRCLSDLLTAEMPRSFPLFHSPTLENSSSSQKETTITDAPKSGSKSSTQSDLE